MKKILAILALVIAAGAWGEKAPGPLDPKVRYDAAMTGLAKAKTEAERFYALNAAEKEAYNTDRKEEARAYAQEHSKLLPKYRLNWNYGNAVQDVNMVLGRIALAEGKTEEAKKFLLKSADSSGSPQMNSFGPNMCLAKDLLEKGERQVVLEYFKECGSFWKSGQGKLDEWAKQVKAGAMPDFGGNLYY